MDPTPIAATAPEPPPRPSLSSRFAKRARVGVFPIARVRFFSFVVIALTLFVTAGLCVMAVWDCVPEDVGWRAVATFVIVASAMSLFALFNALFGSSAEA